MIENGGSQLRERFAFTVFVLLAERLLHKFTSCPVQLYVSRGVGQHVWKGRSTEAGISAMCDCCDPISPRVKELVHGIESCMEKRKQAQCTMYGCPDEMHDISNSPDQEFRRSEKRKKRDEGGLSLFRSVMGRIERH